LPPKAPSTNPAPGVAFANTGRSALLWGARQAAWATDWELETSAERRIVDKPAGVACAGASGSGFPSLSERLAEHCGQAWAAVWELPEAVSGVVALVPGSTQERALGPAPEFECLAALEDCDLRPSGTLPGPTPVTYRVERRREARALVTFRARLWPTDFATLLRRTLPAVGAEAVPTATRVFLHFGAVGEPFRARAAAPPEFDAWLQGGAAGDLSGFETALRRALALRGGFLPNYDALRILHEHAGDIAGVRVDRYGPYAVLGVSSESAFRDHARLAECLMAYGARGVYLKRHLRADVRREDTAHIAPVEPVAGQAAPRALYVRLGRVGAWARLADGLSTGLFLDQRAAWSAFGRRCAGRSLLNLFCYTGMFTLGAAEHGAQATCSVDLARAALSRLNENLELNGRAGSGHRLLPSDAQAWLGRAGRQGLHFERIVVDPPSFGTSGKKVLSTARDLPDLLQAVARVASPHDAELLCISHQRDLSARDFEQLASAACRRMHVQASVVTEPWLGPWDCPTVPGVSEIKSVLVRWSGRA
jgi:23S rRNA G2069 N7-methylase RlmK/C1962 C5-methylase RlmI